MIHTHIGHGLPQPPEQPYKSGLSDNKAKIFIVFAIVFFFLFLSNSDYIFSILNPGIIKKIYEFFFHKGIFLFVISPYFLFNYVKYLKYKKIIADVPTSKIRSAAMGMVEIKGLAKRKYNLLSPVAKLPCIYYRVKKYKRSSSADDGGGWRWYQTETSGNVPFYLEDDTGRIIVYPEGADFFPLKKESHVNLGGFYAPGVCYCVPVNEKWEEELILDSSPLYILGWAEYPFQSDRSQIKNIRLKILRKIKSDKDILMKYDADNNGEIDQVEWENAMSDAEKEAYKIYLRSADKNKEHFVMLEPPYKGFPMLIAPTKIEEKLIKRYAIYTLLNLIALLGCFISGSVMFFSN